MTAIAIFGLATITIAQLPSYVPTNGLVGWWPFNGNANDESGNGNNGTVNGASLIADRFANLNSAYNFDGVNDIIDVNNITSVSNNWTISLWFNSLNSSMFEIQNIIGLGSSPSIYGGSGLAINGGLAPNQCPIINNFPNTILLTDASQECGQLLFSENYTNNNWYNITITSTNSNYFIYINSTSNSNGILNNIFINELHFGNRATLNFQWFQGIIDDIGIWNRVLTQQEITDLYNGCQLSVSAQPTNQTINVNNNAQFVVSSSDPGATYQWQTDLGVGYQNLNSVGQYSGTTNDTLTVSNVTMSNNNQPFRCIISSGSCTDTSDVAVLTVNNNVGINESSQDNLFTVFPNPAQNIINVKVDNKLIGQVYSIYDNTGKVVLTGKLNSQNTTIELNNLSGGVYMLSVGDNMNQSFKVIKE